MSFIKYTILSLLSAAGLVYNLFWGHFTPLGIGFTVVFFVFLGLHLGQNFWSAEKFVSKLLLGILALISAAVVLLSITYYFYEINDKVIAAFVVAAPILIEIIVRLFPGKQPPPENTADAAQKIVKPKIAFVFFLLNVFFLAITAYIFVILAKARTEASIVSPWQTAPPVFFLVFFAFILIGLLLLGAKWKENYNLPILALSTFVFLGVALIVYKFGYGFDSFIHRAAENYIGGHGAIYPKSPYYIGQYVAVITLAKLLAVKIDIVDKLFLPIFASVYLPLAGLFTLGRLFDKKTAPFLALLVFLIPPSNLIVTTPYGLALVFLLIMIFLGLNYLLHGRPIFLIVALLALTTFFIHPIVGIPALTFALLLLTFRKAAGHPIVLGLAGAPITAVAAISIPGALILASRLNGSLSLIWRKEFVTELPTLFLRYNYLLDFVYLYKTYFFAALIILAVVGLFAAKRRRATLVPLSGILMSLGLLIGYLIIKNFALFPSLAAEENQNYALRLMEIGTLFLLPALYFAAAPIFANLKNAPAKIRLAYFLLLAALFTTSFYLTYPRRDIYETDHGWSLGQNHLAAAKFIEADAGDKTYVVLADQAAAAAALNEFGFSNFKNGRNRHLQNQDGEIFYYPIPLGGKLYGYFLRAIYEGGGPEILNEAKKYAGADAAYLVITNYWDNYSQIKARFIQSGAKIKEIGGQTAIISVE